MAKQHLSASSLSMLMRCAQQWEWRYVLGIKAPPGVALIVGKGTHISIEADLTMKLKDGHLMDLGAVQTLAAEAVASEWEREAPALGDDEKAEGEAKVRGAAVDTAVSLASLHHAEVAPQIAPVALEREVRVELPGPYDLLGYIDIEEELGIIDTKTAGKAPDAEAAAKSLQLTVYHLAREREGRPADFVRLDHLVKGKKPKVVQQQSTRDATDHARLIDRIDVCGRQIQAGVFPPCDPSSWCCSPRWCGYWSRCRWGAKQAVAVQAPAVDW